MLKVEKNNGKADISLDGFGTELLEEYAALTEGLYNTFAKHTDEEMAFEVIQKAHMAGLKKVSLDTTVKVLMSILKD